MTPHAAKDARLTFQEVMRLAPLPEKEKQGKTTRRYMSQRAPYVPSGDLPFAKDDFGPGKSVPFPRGKGAYGGHVYGQSGMAASRALAEIQDTAARGSRNKKLGIHTIHGYFPEAALVDRPFIYEVVAIAANAAFPNLLVTVRQPLSPSTNPAGDHFPIADSELPLGPVCFNALVSFRPSGVSQLEAQEPSAQARFADILGSRPPSAWLPSPFTDIESIVAMLPTREVGTFPAVDMKKVDLAAFNASKPFHERRELILYRLLAPLPADDPNTHIMTHAFEADRNGLLMLGNHAGFGFDFGRAASLSYSFVVHVNAEDAMMSYGENEWWVQEACFPRLAAGRGVLLSKIWSPKGVHVATEYQDGIIRRAWKEGERQGKL